MCAREPGGQPKLRKRRHLDLNQRTRGTPTQHVRRRNPRPLKRLLAIGSRRPTHIPFHVSQPGTTSTRPHVSATRTSGQISRANRANFVQLRRISPNFSELLPPQIPAGQRKLHARKNIAVRRNVAGSMPGTAGKAVHDVVARSGGRRAELFHIAHQLLAAENLLKLGTGKAQRENRSYPHPSSA